MELYKYIDFKNMFIYLIEQHKTELEEHKHESDTFMKILNFYEHDFKIFDILDSDCLFMDEFIDFIFEHSENNANESNTESDSQLIFIRYSRVFDEFTVYDYEG